MKKNVLARSIQAMFGDFGACQSVELVDYGAAGHALVVPYFEHQPSPLLHFVIEDQNRGSPFPNGKK
jgi:hypothetical protein